MLKTALCSANCWVASDWPDYFLISRITGGMRHSLLTSAKLPHVFCLVAIFKWSKTVIQRVYFHCGTVSGPHLSNERTAENWRRVWLQTGASCLVALVSWSLVSWLGRVQQQVYRVKNANSRFLDTLATNKSNWEEKKKKMAAMLQVNSQRDQFFLLSI